MTSRRDFFKKACISGACLCGFNAMLESKTSNIPNIFNNETDKKETMHLKWITELLENLDKHLTESQLRQIVKTASVSHYQHLDMENILAPFKGDMNRFIEFIEKEWGWKVSYENDKQVVMADENKSYCVCPLLKNDKERKYPALCYCSEGFAERMFSMIYGSPVNARVISSIQRGDSKCVYRIDLNS